MCGQTKRVAMYVCIGPQGRFIGQQLYNLLKFASILKIRCNKPLLWNFHLLFALSCEADGARCQVDLPAALQK